MATNQSRQHSPNRTKDDPIEISSDSTMSSQLNKKNNKNSSASSNEIGVDSQENGFVAFS